MASRRHSWLNPVRAAAILLACLFVFVGVVQAEPDYKELKAEIKKLEQAATDARKERNDADAKLDENLRAQKKASGEGLAKLKEEGRKLSDTAKQKADTLASAEQSLAEKQGELREAAAAHAVKQLTDAAAIGKRVGEARTAIADWRAALGTLPEVPRLNSLEGIDPEEWSDIRSKDKRALEAFDKWAAAEETRTGKEIKQAKEVLDGEAKWKTSKDGADLLLDDAKALKQTLEQRKKDLADLRQTAKERLKQIK